MKKWVFIAIGLAAAIALSGTLGYFLGHGGQASADWYWYSPTVTAEVGDSFLLSLESNPTTGYAWQAQFDEGLLELVEARFEPSSDAIGAGGIESFEFRALAEGDTEITLLYKRSWEEGHIEQVIADVHITEAAD